MEHYLLTIAIIVISAVSALIIKKYFLQRLRSWSEKTKWNGDDILVTVLDKSILLWMILGGAFISLIYTPLPHNEKILFEKVFLVVFILSIAISLSTMVVSFFRINTRKRAENHPTTSIFINFIRILIFFVAVLVILESFQISIIPFLTALGIGGLAIALALQDTLSNFFSGFYMLVSHNFKPRDYVELESGERGYIQDINWRNTTILMLDNTLVIIPNSKIASSIIKNYSRPDQELAVLIEARVSYNSNLKKVEKVVEEVGIEIMEKIPGAIEEFKPFIRYHTFGDSGIEFTVILRAQKFVDRYLVKHEFIKALHEKFREENIEIPFPQLELHGNA